MLVSVPKPHTRLQEVAQAVQFAKTYPQVSVCLVMPKAAYADHRWDEWNGQAVLNGFLPPKTPIYSKRISRTESTDESWVAPVVLNTSDSSVHDGFVGD